VTEPVSGAPTPPATVSVGEIFRVFLLLGATSFGGGVVAYLRSSLVGRHRWLDDTAFVEMLSISQTLPGLNATNMAVLAGDRLRGTGGALAAICGICLPGALVMFVVGVLYGHHAGRPAVGAMLHGVAAAAVGLVTAVSLQIGRRSLGHLADVGFVALSILGVHGLALPVPAVLVGVGALAIWWHRPRQP
jgi:chromate transporter